MSSPQAWVLHQAPGTPNHSSPAYRHALTLKAAPTFLKQQLYKVKPSGNQGVADQWAVHHFLINGSYAQMSQLHEVITKYYICWLLFLKRIRGCQPLITASWLSICFWKRQFCSALRCSMMNLAWYFKETCIIWGSVLFLWTNGLSELINMSTVTHKWRTVGLYIVLNETIFIKSSRLNVRWKVWWRSKQICQSMCARCTTSGLTRTHYH